jgi:hypothetical protein
MGKIVAYLFLFVEKPKYVFTRKSDNFSNYPSPANAEQQSDSVHRK